MWYIHTVVYYLPIKSNEGLIHVAPRMNLESGVPSKNGG
jgi:hypothetical protein